MTALPDQIPAVPKAESGSLPALRRSALAHLLVALADPAFNGDVPSSETVKAGCARIAEALTPTDPAVLTGIAASSQDVRSYVSSGLASSFQAAVRMRLESDLLIAAWPIVAQIAWAGKIDGPSSRALPSAADVDGRAH